MKRRIVFFVFFCLMTSVGATKERPATQTLFLALDGIPYNLIQEMREEGDFAQFREPTKVISTFPSTTVAGFSGIFEAVGAQQPPGYEEKYFSYETQSVHGSIIGSYGVSEGDFHDFFDFYRTTPFQKIFIYAAPGFSGRLDLDRTRKIIWSRAEQRNYLCYIGATDGAGHILGKTRLKRWLRFLDRRLKDLRADYARDFGRPLQVVLFSDHGFLFHRPKPISNQTVLNRLDKAGFRMAKNLKRPGNVVPIGWGNISGGSFYTRPEEVAAVAELLRGIRGMDLIAYRDSDRPGRIILLDAKNKDYARILCRKSWCRYDAVSGDPLNYNPVAAWLRKRGEMDRDGFAPKEAWLQATRDHRYPDALFRLHEAFFNIVRNPATILFSARENYEYGGMLTRFGARLHGGIKGTHGGLFQEASAAMVMTTDPKTRLPKLLRYDQVMRHFDLARRFTPPPKTGPEFSQAASVSKDSRTSRRSGPKTRHFIKIKESFSASARRRSCFGSFICGFFPLDSYPTFDMFVEKSFP